MANYEQIKKANESLKLTPIKGKDYVEVNQRVKGFRMVYPDGFIQTEMIVNDGSLCVFKARVGFYAEDMSERVLGTGTAFEERNASYINKTSYIENCETSAVGRALGMAGFGIDTAIRSAEEQNSAMAAQEELENSPEAKDEVLKHQAQQLKPDYKSDEKVDGETLKFIVNVMPAERLKKALSYYGAKVPAELTKLQAGQILNQLKKEGLGG